MSSGPAPGACRIPPIPERAGEARRRVTLHTDIGGGDRPWKGLRTKKMVLSFTINQRQVTCMYETAMGVITE